MSIRAQIESMTNPQEFARLCNATLRAEHGDDFLPIDDDRADRGNDGYLKSERKIFAAHCFKRVQNQGLDVAIRSKMIGDLGKAAALKDASIWDIEAWTFLSNYPIHEALGAELVAEGTKRGISVSWRGPEYFEQVLLEHEAVRAAFPELLVIDLTSALARIGESLGVGEEPSTGTSSKTSLPTQLQLIKEQPDAWEYLLFARTISDARAELEPMWQDHRRELTTLPIQVLDWDQSVDFLGSATTRLVAKVEMVEGVFDGEGQVAAFGKLGEAGDPQLIKHFAEWIVRCYRDFIDWAAELRAIRGPDELNDAFRLAAEFVDRPLADMQSFMDLVVLECEGLPERVNAFEEGDPPIRLTLTLKLDTDPDVLQGYLSAVERAYAQ